MCKSGARRKMTGLFTFIGLCAVIFTVPVTGVNFSISKEKVLLGSTGRLTMSCDVNEVDVQIIYLIQIRRIKSTTLSGALADDWQTLASMQISTNEIPTLDPGITAGDKDYVAEGSWDSKIPANTFLSLSMNMEKLVCEDARYYRCELSYRTMSSNTINVEKNATFAAYVKPKVTSLIVRKNGFIVQGLSSTDTAAVEVGDQLELTCNANVGSLPGTVIRWHKTSETASTDEFIGYQPPEGTYDDGTATSDNQCGYTRVAKIKYNATAADANRDNKLAFECYVTISGDPYGNPYTTEENPGFYADVTGQDGGNSGANIGTAGGSDTAAIIGGVIGGLVFIVLIVLLVYFLWYRRRNSGEDLGGDATKEEYGSENPNIAPPISETYATVDKHKKRGHENRGLDEPHEGRRHHYDNTPGRSNHAMDDDDDFEYGDDRDGSPNSHSINHMGMDPHGRIGTGV